MARDRQWIPLDLILAGFAAADVERALRAGGIRLKRLSRGHPGQVEAVQALIMRELHRNQMFRAGLARGWERADPDRATRLRAAIRSLGEAPDGDAMGWFRNLVAAEGWVTVLQACYWLGEEFPVLSERIWCEPAVRAEFQEWWDETAPAAEEGAGPAEAGAEPDVAADEAEVAHAAGRASAKEVRLDQLLRAAEKEVRRLKDERADLQRRLSSALARAETYRQQAHKARADRDLAVAQLKAVAGWPAPRERVVRLVQALQQALAEREDAVDRANMLALELADARGPAAADAVQVQVAAARQS